MPQAPQPRTLDEATFTALEDRLISEAPPGLSESDLDRWIEPRLEQLVAEAEYGPAKPQGSAGGRFLESAVVGPVKAIYGALPIPQALGGSGVIGGPVGAVKGLAQASVDQFGQGVEAARQGRLTEAAGRFGAAIPVVGPGLGMIGDQFAAGDVAGAMGSITGMAAPFGAGRVVKGARAIVPAGARGRVAGALERGAEARATDVIVPKGVSKANIQAGRDVAKHVGAVTEMIGEEGAPWSRSGLQTQVQAKAAAASEALDSVADARLSARTFPTRPIIADLERELKGITSEAVDASHAVREATAPSAADLAKFGGEEAAIKAHERAFMLRWMADDLDAVTYESGTMTKGARDLAEREWIAGDEQSHRYGIGPMSARTPGTPLYGKVDAVVPGTYHTKSKRFHKMANQVLEGKDVPEDFLAIADNMIEAFEKPSERYPKGRFVGQQSPASPPKPDWDPGTYARFFGEESIFPETMTPDPTKPQPTLKAVPLGEDVVPGPNRTQAKYLRDVIDEIKTLGPVARYESIRRIRQAHDQVAKAQYNAAVTPKFQKVSAQATAARKATGALREHLAKWDPETALANQDFHVWKSLDDVMTAAEDRARVTPKVGRQIMARLSGVLLGGQAGGGLGAAAGAVLAPQIEAALSSVTTKLQTARLMTKLAAAIRRGDVVAVNAHATELRGLAKKAAPTMGVGLSTSPNGSQTLGPEGIPQ